MKDLFDIIGMFLLMAALIAAALIVARVVVG